jgi:mRNA-degrading endonuclease RelE of RelBE toxin-antitoxin system
MKFFIHDRCWNKLLDLPKATQKKVLEFQKKFRENSKQNSDKIQRKFRQNSEEIQIFLEKI